MTLWKVPFQVVFEAVELIRGGVVGATGVSVVPTPDAGGSELRSGQGRIIDSEDGSVGVFRDAAGELHAVVALCTHMNWPLEFDGKSRCWVCPRHGARFAVDGTVLRGPADTPLSVGHISAGLRAELDASTPPA
ncbi:Rieske 2Fe-2S domain-containing protein [Mycolicibacterium llatzerense]|uniref:Rieske 2Fe-2S domain-containing protein n=1 Tax=Mycolicibacterium llatzerense TaxID=280871 RepID=UPI0038993DB5